MTFYTDLTAEDPVNGKRVVNIKITFEVKDKDTGLMTTVHEVMTKLPTRKRGGVAWMKKEGLVTEEQCRDTAQMELDGTRKPVLVKAGGN